MGVKLMYVFVLPNIEKQLCTKICFSSLDVSKMFLSAVPSLYNIIMHYLNSFSSCSIKNLTLASLSRLFTIKIDVLPLFTSFDFHCDLFS